MDSIDNPDHGAKVYNGVRVVNKTFDPNAAQGVSSVSPDGGPNFPATEDVEISSAPTN